MRRTVVLTVAGWLAAAFAATAAGVAVVTLIGHGLVGPEPDDPLSQDQVAAALAATPSPAGPPATTPTAPTPVGTPPGAAPSRPAATLLGSPGGTVLARCSGGEVTLANWSPATGYAVGEVRAGPAHDGRVTFERGDDDEDGIEVRVECGPDGVPEHEWRRD
jgi:hypothetical protein